MINNLDYCVKQVCKIEFKKDSQALMKLFKEISGQIIGCGLEIKQIKSTTVFPEIITTNGKSALHWDMQYWIFYERFLTELLALFEKNSYREQFINNVAGIYYDFITLKLLQIPELSYCIQVNRERLFPIQNKPFEVSEKVYNKYFGDSYKSIRVQTRYLVFYHELFHF